MAYYVRTNLVQGDGDYDPLEYGSFGSYRQAKRFLEKHGYREEYEGARYLFVHASDQTLTAMVRPLLSPEKFSIPWLR